MCKTLQTLTKIAYFSIILQEKMQKQCFVEKKREKLHLNKVFLLSLQMYC